MPESRKDIGQDVEVQEADVREPWPEEDVEASKRARATSYLREHPGVKWGLVIAVLVIIVGGYFVWRHYSAHESTDDAQVDGHITPMSARVGGTVIAVNFQDNQFVEAGTVLAQLDPRDYEVALERAKAELADAEASAHAAQTSIPVSTVSTTNQLATARASHVATQREVEAARARLREAQATYQRVSKDLERMQQLVERDEISRQQFDATVAAEQSARATVDAAQAGVAAAESHVVQAEAGVRTAGTGPEQVAITRARFGSAQASVQKYQAAVAMAELNLRYTTIKAPASGIVSKRSVEVGQVIQPGQPLAALVSMDDIYVTANFKETQLKDMRPGQPVTIHVDAYDKDFEGHVDSVGGATGARFSLLPPENATGNFVKVVQRIPVKITFKKGADPQHLLRPGMSVVPSVRLK
ncbi:MAG TPA: HlyD family secretion protein [Clostridia bacterium]|nr:HlyD family secretion protein [Clostridia bacterium]